MTAEEKIRTRASEIYFARVMKNKNGSAEEDWAQAEGSCKYGW